MTNKKSYALERQRQSHTTFGGIIYPSDFNTHCTQSCNPNGSPIAQRIVSDWRFDEQCRRNSQNRAKQQQAVQQQANAQPSPICAKS